MMAEQETDIRTSKINRNVMRAVFFAASISSTLLATELPSFGFQSGTITKINSASFAYGGTKDQVRSEKFKISDFDVNGSDKLVVTIASELAPPFQVNVKFAGRQLVKVVQQKGLTTAGIFYLDDPSKIAKQGDILVYYTKSKGGKKIVPNGVAMHAVALAGTAPESAESATGKVGEPLVTIQVTADHSYVIAAAASDDLSKVPADSTKYIVASDAPFAEVGQFNGLGNAIGSALAATAEIADCPAEEITARFLGLSNRRNRETVVVAAFAPAGETE